MKYLTLCLTAIALLFTVGCSRVATEVNDLDGGDGETTESSDAISVNPASATIPAKGETFSTTVSSAADWILTGGEEVSWCEPSIESGSNGDVVTFTVKPNTTASERNVIYTFRCGDESAELTITQSAPVGQDDSDSYTIYYTTYHLQPVLFNSTATFGANLVSHTYTDGTGKMIFDGPVTQIGGRAFENCIDLTSITIPESVIEIGDYAFSGCSKLKDITIPRSVTKIGDYAFFGCKGGNITISGGVIGNYAFEECSMTNLTITGSVTEIGQEAFSSCSNLTSVNIPDGIAVIRESTFSGCSSLTDITIPESVTQIGTNAFYGCSSLTSITIPGSVTEIGYRAFAGCSGLTTVYCKATTPPGPWYYIDFGSSCTVYVPKGSESDYMNSAWRKYKIVGYDFN